MKHRQYTSLLPLIAGLFALLTNPVLILGATHNPDLPKEAEVVVRGTVVDAKTNETLPGVNIQVKDKVIGTSTEKDGSFELQINQDPPVVLIFSSVGYINKEVKIASAQSEITVRLEQQTIMGKDIVVSASRVRENILKAPVTIEKMDIIDIRNTASDNYYKALSTLKGVDMTSSSINFQIINSRGFNSTGNIRMVQLVDGMDTQAPALNFPISNLNGPNKLDVERIEYIPGTASALYGPNAFNGILLINSKDPFRYQGLSIMLKSGINHIDGNESLGEPGRPQPMWNTAIRYARAFNDKFAFKVNFAYSRANDWRGIDYSDKNKNLQGQLGVNPAYNGVHTFGDDGSFNIALLGFNSAFVQNVSSTFGISPSEAQKYAGAIPSQPVNRTGYREEYLVDYGAENLKVNTALHYRLTEDLEASYTFNFGYGTSVYTGAQRYSLKNFNISQHKIELKSDNFDIKAYGTFENSGDSYIADFVGYYINGVSSDPGGSNPAVGDQMWFGTYGATVVGAYIQQVAQTTGSKNYNAAVVNAINSNPATLTNIYKAARAQADAGRYAPGSAQFNAAKDAALENTIPQGARFNDKSRFYQVKGQYDFKDDIDFMGLLAGASFRQFQLRSNGTIFDDANGGININEWGMYLQASKSLFGDKLDLTGSARYDKNENFDGQFSPRISGVFTVAPKHNIRASFQTGFRNPDTQAQYIDLNIVTARLLGGLPQFANIYKITNNAYTMSSVQAFTNNFLFSGTPEVSLLDRFTTYHPVKPEQVQGYEFGYKGLFGDKLYVDAAYYYNIFDDFITNIVVRKASGPFTGDPGSDQAVIASLLSGGSQNTYQIYTNFDETVKAQGAVVGLQYSLPANFRIGANYNWNKLITDLGAFENNYNTPEHKMNLTFGNRRLTDQIGFNVAFRWQDDFQWNSSFVSQHVDAVSTFDAQVNYRIPEYNATIKLGGSDLFNKQYTLSGGGPNIGAIYYVSLTFDPLFR